MKTNREVLAETYPLHFQRICEEVHAQNKGRYYRNSNWLDTVALGGGSEALCSAFLWNQSAEGQSYWSRLAMYVP